MSTFDPSILMNFLQKNGGSASPDTSQPIPAPPASAGNGGSDSGQGSQRLLGVKPYLSNILSGVGEQIKSTIGLPTEDEQRQTDAANAAAQQKIAQGAQQTQTAIANHVLALKQMQSPVTIPHPDSGQPVQVPFVMAKSYIAKQAQDSGQPFMVVPNVGLWDTKAGKLTPDDIQAGITVTQPIAQHFGFPLESVGQKVSLGTLAQREQQAAQVPPLNVPGADNGVSGLSDLARPTAAQSTNPLSLQLLQAIKAQGGTLPPNLQAALDNATAPPIGSVPGAQPNSVQNIPSSLTQPQGGQIPQSGQNNAAAAGPVRLTVINGKQVLVGANGQPITQQAEQAKKPNPLMQVLRNFAQGYTAAEDARLGIPTALQKAQINARIGLETAQTAETNARTQTILNPTGKPNATQLEFDKAGNLLGFRDARGNLLGPNNPNLTPDMKDMLNAAEQRGVATTPEGQVMSDLIKKGMTSAQAYQQLQTMKGVNKPDTAVEHKQQFEGIVQKAIAHADGSFDPGVMTDIKRLGVFIRDSNGLTDTEKQSALSYLAANGSPAATGTAAEQRGAIYGQAKSVQVLDTYNKNRPVTINMDDLNAANATTPDRYISATGGAAAIGKKNLMEDIKGASQNMSSAIDNLKSDFPVDMRFKLTLALKSRDPQSAVSALLASEAVNKMTPDQQDYLIALNQVIENAMAMRSMLGAGQGSEDVRHAISNTLPGLLTANKGFAKKQMAAFIAQQDRLSRGIPDVPLNDGGRSNAPTPSTPAPSASPAAQPSTSLVGPVQPGERTATGPNGQIVFRGSKWIDPKTGSEVK